MRQKDREHFGIHWRARGQPGEGRAHWRASSARAISRGSPLARTVKSAPMFGRCMVSIAVEYGYKHLGASILASDLDAVKNSVRRRFHTTIAMASWRGYANMLLGRIQYVGKAYAFNKVQRQYRLVDRWSTWGWTRGPLVPGHVHT